jgi:hypothetical protein
VYWPGAKTAYSTFAFRTLVPFDKLNAVVPEYAGMPISEAFAQTQNRTDNEITAAFKFFIKNTPQKKF